MINFLTSAVKTCSQGEDICDAAVREVKEETGVRQFARLCFIFW